MPQIVTLELPDEVIERARDVADSTHRRLEDVLAEWLDRASADIPVESLPDDRLLALANLEMDPEQQQELNDLLDLSREGQLDDAGRWRLEDLMQVYRRGMVRKAQALRAAVERGLKSPSG